MNKEDKEIIKNNTGKYEVCVCKLGEYDSDIRSTHNTLKDAKKELERLIKTYDSKGYYADISKILIVKRDSDE